MGAIKTEKPVDSSSEDKFGYEDLAKNLNSEVLGQMELPNNFGLYGNWGSGKSTLVNFMIQDLDKNPDIATVYFEAWKYEYSEGNDLLFALLNCVKESLGIDNKEWKKIAISLLTIGDNLLKKVSINAKDIKKSGEMYEEMVYAEHESWQDKVKSFENDFQKLISLGLNKNKKTKLYIFIDDLDRCLPENTVKLLEAIKNFLYVEKTLFIFAIDKRVVSQMISHQYGMLVDYGEEYLMKIINYEYSLPSINNSEVINDIFDRFGYQDKSSAKNKISEFLVQNVIEARKIKSLLSTFFITMKIKKINIDDETNLIQFFISFYLIKNYLFENILLTEIRNYCNSSVASDIKNQEYKGLIELLGFKKLDELKKIMRFEVPYSGRGYKNISNHEVINDFINKVSSLR